MVTLGTHWVRRLGQRIRSRDNTASADFPVTAGRIADRSQQSNQGTAFVSKIGPNGQGSADLIYSTYYGGTVPATPVPDAADFGLGIAVSGYK